MLATHLPPASRRSTSTESVRRLADRCFEIAVTSLPCTEEDAVDNVRIIALPVSNPLAATENGVFPAGSDDRMATLRLDHRLATQQTLSVRYNHEDQRSLRTNMSPASDTNQTDVFNRSRSLVVEEIWNPTQNAVNAFRVHVLNHRWGPPRGTTTSGSCGQRARQARRIATPRSCRGPSRPSPRRSTGIERDTTSSSEGNSRSPHTTSIHTSSRTAYFGSLRTRCSIRMCRARGRSHSSSRRRRSFHTARGNSPCFCRTTGSSAAGFGQRRRPVRRRPRPAAERLLRRALDNPSTAALGQFSADAVVPTRIRAPRLEPRGTRVGTGILSCAPPRLYVTRNRPWFQLRAMNQAGSSVVRIAEAHRLAESP